MHTSILLEKCKRSEHRPLANMPDATSARIHHGRDNRWAQETRKQCLRLFKSDACRARLHGEEYQIEKAVDVDDENSMRWCGNWVPDVLRLTIRIVGFYASVFSSLACTLPGTRTVVAPSEPSFHRFIFPLDFDNRTLKRKAET